MLQQSTLLSLIAAAPQLTRCDLCGTEESVCQHAAVLQLSDGSVAERAACDACVRTLRRLEAATGGFAQLALGAPVASVVPTVASTVVSTAPPEAAQEPIRWEYIVQLNEMIEAPEGTRYLVEVYGGPRANGRWVGWLLFRPLAGTRATPWLRTGWETTQSDRAALAHWAGTLGATYVQGAFGRARPLVGPAPLG
jgi:hypothetical protein